MAQFGVFDIRGGARPLKTFEGDYMTQNQEFVSIYKRAAISSEHDAQVAAINLQPGTAVRKISD
jgi:hypothetical protein